MVIAVCSLRFHFLQLECFCHTILEEASRPPRLTGFRPLQQSVGLTVKWVGGFVFMVWSRFNGAAECVGRQS